MSQFSTPFHSNHRAVRFIEPALPGRRKTTFTVSCAGRYGISSAKTELMRQSSQLLQRFSTSSSSTPLARSAEFRPTPELGLLSMFFVLSMAVGAIFTLGIISIPAMNSFRKLAASMDKLSKVVLEEVPGTLFSLKLSGLEINDLTQQLSGLRQKISGDHHGKTGRRNSRKGGSNYPIMD